MPNPNTDNQGFATENADKQRDDSAKGGPMTGPGNADSKHGIVAPYDSDTQTQIAALGKKHKKEQDNNTNDTSAK